MGQGIKRETHMDDSSSIATDLELSYLPIKFRATAAEIGRLERRRAHRGLYRPNFGPSGGRDGDKTGRI